MKNQKVIKKEEIKEPAYYEVKRTKNKVDTFMIVITISHACFHKLTFTTQDDTVDKTANEYYLKYRFFEDGKRNINYLYNQRTKLKQVIDLTTELIKQLNALKRFEKE